MILNSQLLSEFVLIRANSWLIYSQCPETPKLPIPPILPLVLLSLIPCALMPLCLVPFSPSCLRAFVAISQLHKTKPISITTKPTQPRVHPVIPTEAPQGQSGGIYFNTATTSETAYLAQFTKKSWPVLCKTNPISLRPKPTQILMPQVLTPIFRLSRFKKNKPNQTQTNPILPPRSAIRPTWRRAVIRCIMIPVSLS